MILRLPTALSALFIAVLPSAAAAQNISGVSGPTVSGGETASEVRFGFEPGEDGADDRFGARVHVQHGLSESLRLRGILFGRERGEGFETNAVAAELLWQITPDGEPTQVGVIGGVRSGWNGTSDRVQVNLAADHKLDPLWSIRGNILGERRIDRSGAPLQFGARARIKRELSDDVALSLEAFSSAGTFSSSGDEELQVGPMVEFGVGRFGVSAGYLAGVHGASDHNFRLFLSTKFN
ncbi:hypothetical protein WJT74_09345 [Sphingomicrobium sp. XHP0239]|uniref:hypothetical protein n=1 Tax=Sphingomicrobium maritimum TaxID=3133972 RepID=UPI0031CC4C34